MRLVDRPDLRALLLGTAWLGCSSSKPADEAAPTLVAAAFSDATTIRLTFSEPMADPGPVDTAAFRLSIGVKDVESTVYYALDYSGLYEDSGDSGTVGGSGPISDGDPTADPTIVDPTDATTGDPTDPTTGDPTVDPSTYDPSDSYDPTGGYEAGDAEGGYEGGYALPPDGPPADFTHPIPPLPIDDLDVTAVALVAGDARQIDLTLAMPVGDSYACDALVGFAAESPKAGIFVHYKPGPLADTAGNPLAAIAPHWIDARASAYVELQGDFPHLDPYLPIPCP